MVQRAQCWKEKALWPVGDQWRSPARPMESAEDSLWTVLGAEIGRWVRSGGECLGQRHGECRAEQTHGAKSKTQRDPP